MKTMIHVGLALFLLQFTEHGFGQYTAYASIFATVIAPVGITTVEPAQAADLILTQDTEKSVVLANTQPANNQTTLDKMLLASFRINGSKHAVFDISQPPVELAGEVTDLDEMHFTHVKMDVLSNDIQNGLISLKALIRCNSAELRANKSRTIGVAIALLNFN
ncbi:MAG: hypothetical protein LWW85_13085 [Marinilabiliales bacterium]|nr:hypothetical protein [Marinilabiliales bacterium]